MLRVLWRQKEFKQRDGETASLLDDGGKLSVVKDARSYPLPDINVDFLHEYLQENFDFMYFLNEEVVFKTVVAGGFCQGHIKSIGNYYEDSASCQLTVMRGSEVIIQDLVLEVPLSDFEEVSKLVLDKIKERF